MAKADKPIRLSKLGREFNVGIGTIVEFLAKKGYEIEQKPMAKVPSELYDILANHFSSDIKAKQESKQILSRTKARKERKELIDLNDESAIDKEEEGSEQDSVVEEKHTEETRNDEITEDKTETPAAVEEDKELSSEEIVDIKAEEKQEEISAEEIIVEEDKEIASSDKSDPVENYQKEEISDEADNEILSDEKDQEVLQNLNNEVETVEINNEQEVDSVDKVETEEATTADDTIVESVELIEEPELDSVSADKAHENIVLENEKAKSEEPAEIEVADDSDSKEVVQEIEVEKPIKEAIEQEEKKDDVDINEVEKIEKTEELEEETVQPKVVGKIDLGSINDKRPTKKSKEELERERKLRNKQKADRKKTREDKQKGKEDHSKKKPLNIKQADKPESKQQSEHVKKEAPVTDQKPAESEVFNTEKITLSGPTVIGKIELPVEEKKKPSAAEIANKKKKRRRIKKEKVNVAKEVTKKKPQEKPEDKKQTQKRVSRRKKTISKPEVSEEDVQKQIKDTLARLTSKGKSKSSKLRRQKREAISQKAAEETKRIEEDKKVLKVTEFISVTELANMMEVTATEVISTCMSLGLFVSINQRLDAETITLVADEFGHTIEFISVDVQESIQDSEEESEEDLVSRSPIVTVMGHVDHGKTSLLDYIRNANVIAGEAGGITQHIGAYNVEFDEGKRITFLDTPGHEAFTAMRARGAQVTDLAIIVVAADDNVMPQTIEAINHAKAAGVPMVFAINKIDKPGANPEKIKEELANMNLLVEDWGGKFQSQDISAKLGQHVDELMEKVLLEAELLELKANPERNAVGTIIESSLDKGRGYVATVLVKTGTLKIGDIMIAGMYTGKVKAMYNERGKAIKKAGPSTPALILGLNGAPQAGDEFNIMSSEKEAREIANKREQIIREQGMRTQKHITLDEIGRRLALGNFQELNLIVKGDVDGSIEALSDSLIKLSTEQIQVNITHKAVGQISETDIMLAAASNAIIIGFQVRPSMSARRLAEKEEIDIRIYSIIYDAINDVKLAMEGMLKPTIREEIVSSVEILQVFKISKVGSVAGCMVKEGKINRNSKIRLIREGIVVYSGKLGSLKRFKDDVKEVNSGYECGLNIENFNDIKVGDFIEAYKEVEVKQKL